MTMRRYSVPILTDSGGAADTTSASISGRIHAIHYIKNASTPFDNTVDITITNETTGETILAVTNQTASASWYPRVATHTTAGAAASFDGTRPVLDYHALGRDRIRVVVAQGGNAKVGVVRAYVDG